MPKLNLLPLTLIAGIYLCEPVSLAARGFCNGDHLGSGELQSQLAEAGEEFYVGGEALMAMMASIENLEYTQARAHGEVATSAFTKASEEYKNVIPLVDGEFWTEYKGFDLQNAVGIAGLEPTSDLVTKFQDEVDVQEPESLFVLCEKMSNEMADKTAEVTGYIENTQLEEHIEQPFARLMGSWGRALIYGSLVSSVFAAGGGETPK